MPARRIDVHQHLVPAPYAAWVRSKGMSDAGGRELPDWDAGQAIELMDRHEIDVAILSLSTPSTTPGDGQEAADIARMVNEVAAETRRQSPDRFGFFATLPLPDVTGAIDEARYALDALQADGVTLLANSRGTYLGSPEFDPLMEELDARGAVAFVHPSSLPGPEVLGIPPFAADFLLDTTRAALNLVRTGVTRRYPRIRFILSHAGGFLPYAAHRVALATAPETGLSLNEVLGEFRRFYFDIALSGSPAALPSLLAFADPARILFGSDWPFAPDIAVSYFTAQFDKYGLASDETHTAINGENALALFPRFAGGDQ